MVPSSIEPIPCQSNHYVNLLGAKEKAHETKMHISHIFFFLAITFSLSVTNCITKPTPTPVHSQASTQTSPSIASATPAQTLSIDTIQGSLRNQISNLEDKMPRANTERYRVPTDQEQTAFAELASSLEAEDLIKSAQLAAENYYTLSYYVDRGDENAMSYLLREMKPIQKGWGLYAFRADSTSNIIIEAPHPRYDRRTSSVALDIYRALDARALLIAGAHRNANSDGSADMAHVTESIFQSVHVALSQEMQAESEEVIILQIHGFHTSKHAGYPRAVFGFGAKIQPAELALAQRLEAALAEQEINVGLCTGDVWQDLCGTTNVQASTTDGVVFIHIELDEKMRKRDDALITALLQVFGK
jgi:hypothetical protein